MSLDAQNYPTEGYVPPVILCPNDNTPMEDGECPMCSYAPANLSVLEPLPEESSFFCGLCIVTEKARFTEIAEYLGFKPITEGHLCVGVTELNSGKVFSVAEILLRSPVLLNGVVDINTKQ